MKEKQIKRGRLEIVKKMKEKVSEVMGIPKEIALDYPRLTMLGKRELYIENFKAIIEYTETCIRLSTSTYLLKISGVDLEIKNISPETLEIGGEITNMEISN